MMALRLLALIVTLGYRPVTSEVPPVGSVVMRIVNAAGAPIELFWVNVFQADEPLVKQTVKPIRNSSDSIVSGPLPTSLMLFQ